MIAAILLGSLATVVALVLAGVKLQSYCRAKYSYSPFSIANISGMVLCVVLAVAALVWPIAVYTAEELAAGTFFDANSVVFLSASAAILLFIFGRITFRTSLIVGLCATFLLFLLASAIVAVTALACAERHHTREQNRQALASGSGRR